MTISVTGATGFVGNYVVPELLKRGIDVNVAARDEKKVANFEWYKKINFIKFDLGNADDETFKKISKCDRLIHLAWDGLPNYKCLFHIEANLMPQYFFIKKMVELGVNDISVTGTCFEYGNISGCLTEDMITDPKNAYAISKDSLRRFLEELQKVNSFQLKWIRLFYIYGIGQNSNSLFAQLEKALINGDAVFNMSGGEQVRDFLPVEEVAKNIVDIALQNKISGIINCSSNEPVTVKDFIVNYLEKKQQQIQLNLGYYPYPDYEPMSFWGDNSKLKSIESK